MRLQQGCASALDMLQLQQRSGRTIRAAHPHVQKRAPRRPCCTCSSSSDDSDVIQGCQTVAAQLCSVSPRGLHCEVPIWYTCVPGRPADAAIAARKPLMATSTGTMSSGWMHERAKLGQCAIRTVLSMQCSTSCRHIIQQLHTPCRCALAYDLGTSRAAAAGIRHMYSMGRVARAAGPGPERPIQRMVSGAADHSEQAPREHCMHSVMLAQRVMCSYTKHR